MEQKIRRKDPRTEATRKALIEAAEGLFARMGFEAVTMKEIGDAIGSRNKVVAAYHFGSKSELIDAIYLERIPKIEARRAYLLAELDAQDRGDDLRGLLSALWLPLTEMTNSKGERSYALFLGSMLRDGIDRTRRIVHEASPTTREIVDRIVPRLPTDSGPVRDLRWQLATGLVLNAIQILERGDNKPRDEADFQTVFAEALTLGLAALTAPMNG